MSPSRSQTRISRVGADVDGGPRGGAGAALFVSVVLHAGIIAATLVTLSHARFDIADEAPPVVPVDLVTIAPKTNIAPTVAAPPKVHQDEIQPPSVDQLTQPNVPALEQQSEAAPPDQAPSEPMLKKPVPIPTPRLRPDTKPMPDQKKKNPSEDFSALLNKLTAPSAAPPNARVSTRTMKGIGQQDAMTMDLVDALRNQIAQCWSAPVGSPHPERLIVEMEVFLNPDGSVAQPPQLGADSASAVGSDPFMRAAAEAAKRAIYVCAPYKLPGDRYQTWRDLNVIFDPRKMAGG
jgi:hypothetical protein